MHGAVKAEEKLLMQHKEAMTGTSLYLLVYPGSVRTVNPEDRLVGASINSTHVQIWAINLNSSKGAIGSLLYNTAWNAPSAWAEGNQTISWSGASLIDNVTVLISKECLNYYAFD